eukprot:Lithocolla_globosa_v1_NODE_146_length_5712_cov_12.381121.p2 type:complete len:418 gc:universal NODE_146_length_5712_cov_12.381121:363-1616(+)
MKKKDLPILSIGKSSGNRYITYRGKKYKLVSSLTNKEILQDLLKVAERLEKQLKKKRKRNKKLSSSNVENPVLKANSSTSAPKDSEKIARLQLIEQEFKLRNLLGAPQKNETPQPLPTIPHQQTPTLPQPPTPPAPTIEGEELVDVVLQNGEVKKVPKSLVEGYKQVVKEWEETVAKLEKKAQDEELKFNELKTKTRRQGIERYLRSTNSEWKAIAKGLNPPIPTGHSAGRKNEIIDKIMQRSNAELDQAFNDEGLSSGAGSNNSGLWNYEIDKLMKQHRNDGYKGTFSLDQVKHIKLPGSAILNLSKSNEIGSHWIALLVSSKSVEIFDSFGDEPPTSLIKDLKLAKKEYQLKINRVKHQRANTSNCGYFAMKFLKDRYTGKTFKEATGFEVLEKSIKKEKDIERFKEMLSDFEMV